MSIGMACVCSVLVGAWLLPVQQGVTEVNEMGPWPDPEVEPDELLDVDLSYLGLKAGKIQNAQDQETWANGRYELGRMIAYDALGKETVYV